MQPNSSRVVAVSTAAPSSTLPGNYSGRILVENATARQVVPFTLHVAEYRNWSIAPHRFNATVSTNTTAGLGFLSVDNTGNVDLQVGVSVNSSGGHDLADILDVNQRFIAFRNGVRRVPVNASTAASQQPGLYNGSLAVSVDGALAFDIPVRMRVVDDVRPSIAVQVNDTEATRPTTVQAAVGDNVQVARVEGEVLRRVEDEVQVGNHTEVRVGNKSVASFTFDKRNAGQWLYTFTKTRHPGDYLVEATVTDTSGNARTVTASFSVENLDAVRVNRSTVSADAVQVGSWSESDVFSLEVSTPVQVELETFQYGESNQTLGNATVRLEMPTGGKKFFDAEGATVNVSSPGTYRLRVKGPRRGTYNARLKLHPLIGEDHVSLPTLTVTGSFTPFSTPDDLQREWQGADFLMCSDKAYVEMLGKSYTWKETNVRKDARYVCVIPFKATMVGSSFQYEVLPVTLTTWDTMIEDREEEVDKWRSKAGARFWIILFLVFIIVVETIIAVYLLWVRPRFDFDWRRYF